MEPGPTITLANGVDLPRRGFGTAPMEAAVAERSVRHAITAGYRLIDTAENYGNETAVGRGIRSSGIDRDALFVVSKCNREWHSEQGVQQAYAESVRRLGIDRLDMLMLHWPNPDLGGFPAAWRGLLRLLDNGDVRALGTSNFTPAHIERLVQETGFAPHVNQIQLNPWMPRVAERRFHASCGVVTQSWGPLGQGWGMPDPGAGPGLLGEAPVLAASEAHGRTPGQVVLRWHLQVAVAPVAKSATPTRIEENLDILDFGLTDVEMDAISALDRGGAGIIDAEEFGH